MATQTSGAISLADVRDARGATGPISFADMYRAEPGTPNKTPAVDSGNNMKVPTSGEIGLDDMYNIYAARNTSFDTVKNTATSWSETVTRNTDKGVNRSTSVTTNSSRATTWAAGTGWTTTWSTKTGVKSVANTSRGTSRNTTHSRNTAWSSTVNRNTWVANVQATTWNTTLTRSTATATTSIRLTVW